jgi:hypothetical protein
MTVCSESPVGTKTIAPPHDVDHNPEGGRRNRSYHHNDANGTVLAEEDRRIPAGGNTSRSCTTPRSDHEGRGARLVGREPLSTPRPDADRSATSARWSALARSLPACRATPACVPAALAPPLVHVVMRVRPRPSAKLPGVAALSSPSHGVARSAGTGARVPARPTSVGERRGCVRSSIVRRHVHGCPTVLPIVARER